MNGAGSALSAIRFAAAARTLRTPRSRGSSSAPPARTPIFSRSRRDNAMIHLFSVGESRTVGGAPLELLLAGAATLNPNNGDPIPQERGMVAAIRQCLGDP